MTFVDTSGVYAVLDDTNAAHRDASDVWRSLLRNEEALLTSSYVLLELYALVQSRIGIQAVNRLHEAFEPLLDIHWVDAAVHATALAAVLTAGRRQLSLVDCASFVIMRANGVRQAFTLDEHFREQGFQLASA